MFCNNCLNGNHFMCNLQDCDCKNNKIPLSKDFKVWFFSNFVDYYESTNDQAYFQECSFICEVIDMKKGT